MSAMWEHPRKTDGTSRKSTPRRPQLLATCWRKTGGVFWKNAQLYPDTDINLMLISKRLAEVKCILAQTPPPIPLPGQHAQKERDALQSLPT